LDRITKCVILLSIIPVSLFVIFGFDSLYDSVATTSQNFSINDYSIIQHPIILFILAPIALLILFRTDHEKFSYIDLQKVLSCLVVVILVSTVFVTPFGVSSLYWSAAFAAEHSTNSTDSAVDPTSNPPQTDGSNSTESSTSPSVQPTNSTGDPPSSDPTPTEDGNTSVESTTSSNSTSTSTNATPPPPLNQLLHPVLIMHHPHQPILPPHQPILPPHQPILPPHQPILPPHQPILPPHQPILPPHQPTPPPLY